MARRTAPIRIVFAIAVIALVTAASAQPDQDREAFLVATGEGHANVAPDFAEFSAEVTTRAETFDAATKEHKERTVKAAAFLRGLEKQGVTTGRSSFRLEKGRPTGEKKKGTSEYRAVTAYAVKAGQLGALNDAITAIAGTRLFEVRTIRYGIVDEGRAIDEARRAAVKDARRQADVVAGAAGVQLGEIMEITDGTVQSLGSEGSVRLSVPNAQVAAPVTISFRAAISIKWRIRPRP
jgi:uncharacterized protein YggE